MLLNKEYSTQGTAIWNLLKNEKYELKLGPAVAW